MLSNSLQLREEAAERANHAHHDGHWVRVHLKTVEYFFQFLVHHQVVTGNMIMIMNDIVNGNTINIRVYDSGFS